MQTASLRLLAVCPRARAALLPCLGLGSGVPLSIPWVGPGGALSIAGCYQAAVGLTLRSRVCLLRVSPECRSRKEH